MVFQLQIEPDKANYFGNFVKGKMAHLKSAISLRKELLAIALLVLSFFSVSAQNFPKDSSKRNFVLSAQGHYGFIISHHGNVSHLIKGHVGGVEMNYIFRTSGRQCWQPIYNYPEFGICAVHLDLANPSALGSMEALYPYTNIRLNKDTRNFRFNLRMGLGLAYVTKPFNRETNHKNNVIGSHINGFVNLRLSASFMLSKSWRMDTGVGLTHASNGATATPNLGLNIATLNLGIGYVFGNKNLQMKCDSIMPPAPKKWHPSILLVAGLKELEHPDGPKYYAYGAMLNIYRTHSYRTRFGGGIEVAYNSATKKQLINDSVSVIKTRDIIQAGVKISYAFTLDKISFPIDFGVYVYKSKEENDQFFHRIGVRYMITPHLIANITLLTHWAKADYFEWGIGYEF
jgi:hypothetical protein